MCQRGLISPPGGKEYSVRMTGAMTRPLRISKVQIVCGDNVSKPGIEALAFTWIDDKGTAKVADQVDHINGVDHNPHEVDQHLQPIRTRPCRRTPL